MIWMIVYILILVTSILTGIIKLRALNKSNRVFLLLLLSTLSAETIGYIVASSGVSNFIVYHIFTPIQCVIVLFGYYVETKSKFFLYLIVIMSSLGLVLSLWIQPLPAYNSYYMNIELLLFTLISIFYFSRLLSIETDVKLFDYPLFWISCGLILFSVSNFFVLGAFNFVIKSNTSPNKILIMVLSQVRFYTNYIYYCSFIIAFLVKQNTIYEQYGK